MIAAEDLRTRRPRRCLRVTPTRGKTRALGGGFLSSCAPTLLSRACPQQGQHADEKAQYPALLTALSFDREQHLLLQLLVSCSVVLFARHSSHLLYVVVGESAAVLQLLGGEHQALLAGRDPCQNVEQKKKRDEEEKQQRPRRVLGLVSLPRRDRRNKTLAMVPHEAATTNGAT